MIVKPTIQNHISPYVYPGLKEDYRRKAIMIHTHLLSGKMAYIAAMVSEELCVPLLDMQSISRKKELVNARQIAMYLMKQRRAGSLVSIGRYFNRDHSTVIYAVQTVNDLMDTEKAYKKKVKEIDGKIGL